MAIPDFLSNQCDTRFLSVFLGFLPYGTFTSNYISLTSSQGCRRPFLELKPRKKALKLENLRSKQNSPPKLPWNVCTRGHGEDG